MNTAPRHSPSPTDSATALGGLPAGGPPRPALDELPLKWGWLLALGVALVVAGALGTSLAIWLTLASVLLFGALLLASGILQGWHALTAKETRWSGRALHLVVALLYVALGALLLWDPVGGSLSLTIVLAAFLIALGILRIGYAWRARRHRWRWVATVLGGVLNLVLAGIILVGLPGTALWVIGLFVAIEMIVNGALLIGIALTVRRLARAAGGDDASAREPAAGTAG